MRLDPDRARALGNALAGTFALGLILGMIEATAGCRAQDAQYVRGHTPWYEVPHRLPARTVMHVHNLDLHR